MKEFNKEYLIQVINVSANNLRLNTDKLVSVSILKEFIKSNNDIEKSVCDLKKITELSKLGIKLHEIINYLKNNKIDFLTVSETFKSHSHIILPLLSQSLDNISSENLQEILSKYSDKTQTDESSTSKLSLFDEESKPIIKKETDVIKEELIFEELTKDLELDFEEFQRRVLKPIKSIEFLLQRMLDGNYSEDELISYSVIMEEHKKLSEAMSLSLIAKMHEALSISFKMLADNLIIPDFMLVESMRACLIVIVATIKNKNVDITNYFNLAESFLEKIKKSSWR